MLYFIKKNCTGKPHVTQEPAEVCRWARLSGTEKHRKLNKKDKKRGK